MVSKAWQTELRSHRISPRQWPLFGVQQEVPAWDFLRLIPRAEAAKTVGGEPGSLWLITLFQVESHSNVAPPRQYVFHQRAPVPQP